MPGLQSIVSAWTKINHQNLEYYDEYPNGLHPRQQHVGAPSGPGGGHPQAQGPPERDGGVVGGIGGVMDPRATTFANTPQQSLPSSSSLSSYSFAKNGGGTADTNSLTATPTPPLATHPAVSSSAAAAAANLAPPSQRFPMYNHSQPQLSQPQLSQSQLVHDASLLPAPHRSSMTAASSSSSSRGRRSSRHGHHHHPASSGLHSQLESYGNGHHHSSSNNLNSLPPPPPQAGADAILGRRKAGSALVDRSDRSRGSSLSSANNLQMICEPPASLSANDSSPPYALSSSAATNNASNLASNRGGGKNSSLERSPSSSLWHSTRSSSSSSNNNNSGAESVTASLDKMNATFQNVHGGGFLGSGGLRGLPLAADTATIAELNATAENALQSMKSLGLNAGGGVQQQQQQNPNSQNLNHPNFNPYPMPVPQQWSMGVKGRFSRQRLSKSHSRADLVREMALDRNYARKHGSIATGLSSGSSTRDVRNSVSSVDELDASRSSVTSQQQQQQQQQMGGSQHMQQQLLNPQQRRQRVPSFLSTPIEENGAGGVMKEGNSSIGSARQSALGESARNSIGSLSDPSTRNGPTGDHWMRDWFPGHPLPSQRRQSSSGSSGTAITANTRGLGVQGVNDAMGSGSGTFPEKLPPAPAVAAAAANNNSAASGPSHPLPPKQPQQLGTGNPNCDRCAQMESALLTLQVDLEYLRSLDLQREFMCKECDAVSVQQSARMERIDSSLPPINQKTTYPTFSSQRSDSSLHSVGSRGSRTSNSRGLRRRNSNTGNGSIGTAGRPRSQATPNTKFSSRTATFLRDASKRLTDLSTRHKRQVKQTTHERAYWQNDVHLKLEKFAMMCKNLNEEAAHRANQVKEIEALLDKMTSERNTLASQVDTLKARVELYEEETSEQSRLREEWSRERTQMLDSVDNAIKDRDTAMVDLSSRLELAVDTIRNERKQHNMRRQIIFPPTRHQSPSSSALSRLERRDTLDSVNSAPPSSPLYRRNASIDIPDVQRGDDLERIERSREAAEKARTSLEEAMIRSAERERLMQARLNALESELVEARATVAGSGGERREAPSEAGPGMSIRRISSTVSVGSLA